METHSSLLARRIPWTEEPGGLIHGVTENWTQVSDRTCICSLVRWETRMKISQCDPKFPSAPGCIPWSSPPTSGTGRGRGTSRIQPTRSYFLQHWIQSFYLFVWLCEVLIVVCGIVSCGMRDLVSSLTRDWTQVPGLGVQSLPLGTPGLSLDSVLRWKQEQWGTGLWP